MNFTDYESIFLKNCNAKNLALGTITNYKYSLKTFFGFCSQRNISDLQMVNNYIIMDYLADMNKRYSSITVRDKYIVLKAFFTFLVDVELLEINPMSNMKKPKQEQKIIYSFTKEEVNEIMSMFDKNDFIGYRNYTIMNMFFGTGIRKSELLNIASTDIDWGTNLVKIYGKGSKERFIPLGNSLQRILLHYIKLRKEYIAEHKKSNILNLFINKDCRRLRQGAINTLFSKIKGNKPNWSTRVSPHTFRHTFAKFFLLNGGDLFTLQKILGHEDISFTRLYIDLNTNEVSVQNDKFNPLENTRWQYY